LDFASIHKVAVFVPTYEAEAMIAAQVQFAAHGSRVFTVADADTLPRLHDKAWVNREMAGLPLAESTTLEQP
jgi:hypothetical protein